MQDGLMGGEAEFIQLRQTLRHIPRAAHRLHRDEANAGFVTSVQGAVKFTTLFGILAVEIAVNSPRELAAGIGGVFLLIGLFFVLRSFYGMRISTLSPQAHIDFNDKRDADAALEDAAARNAA